MKLFLFALNCVISFSFVYFLAFDKEMKTWDTYVTLEATVKNMLTSLKAVGELQNAAIRERHWHQLINSTKVFRCYNLCFIFCLGVSEPFI